ncbi:MAG: tetratricopeptide repeat protein, partial [Spirochaetaceae bacterium]|nr:tetratricopeptide repeat protein [Spirochaetaceae bacterium]
MKKIILTIVFSLFMVSIFAQQFVPQQKVDALKLYTEGKYKEAISVCEQELKDNPNNLDSYTVLCWSLVRNKQYVEAEQRASDALKVNAYDHRIIEILAEAKFYLGKNKEALPLFEQYISYVPTSGSRIGAAYYYMGEIYIRQGRYQHADISLTMAVRMEPLLDYWWTRLGYAREMAGSYRGAVA